MTPTTARILTWTGITLAVAGCVFAEIRFDAVSRMTALISEDTPAEYFLLLMVVLPIFGFPITLFIVMAGIKFGFIWGFTAAALITPVHLVTAYWVSHSALRPVLTGVMAKAGIEMPHVSEDREWVMSLLVMGMPISYAVKNYSLPLAGIGFVPFFVSGWVIQTAYTVPGLVFGKSAMKMDVKTLGIAVALLVFVIVLARWLKRVHDRNTR